MNEETDLFDEVFDHVEGVVKIPEEFQQNAVNIVNATLALLRIRGYLK